MRFTFVATRQFLTISRLWFSFTASSRIPRFDREPSNSTGGTFTHEVTNFTSARTPKLLVEPYPVRPGREPPNAKALRSHGGRVRDGEACGVRPPLPHPYLKFFLLDTRRRCL